MHVRRTVRGQRCRCRPQAALRQPGEELAAHPCWSRSSSPASHSPSPGSRRRITRRDALLIETSESVFTRPRQQRGRPARARPGRGDQPGPGHHLDRHSQAGRAQAQSGATAGVRRSAPTCRLSRLLVIAGLKSDPNEIPPEERVLKAFREKLNVYRVEKSRVIVIEIVVGGSEARRRDPERARRRLYRRAGAAKQQSNSDATDWLEPEIANLSKRVKEAEARVANFRAQSDLLIGQNNSVLATQQLSELSTELSRVRANRGCGGSERRQRARGSPERRLARRAARSAVVRADPAAARAAGQLKADIADLSTTLLDNHPRIRALQLAACRPRRPDPHRGAEGDEGAG